MARLSRWVTDLVMLLVVAIWALNNVVVKVALQGWITPGTFNAVRFGLGAVLLCGVVLALEGSLRIPRALLPKVALLGLLGLGWEQLLYTNGLARGTANNAGLWMGTVPVLVALMSGLLGLDRITPRVWVGTFISSGGLLIVLLAQGGGLRPGVGDLFLIGAALAWAGYTVFSQPLVRAVSPSRVSAVAMLFAAAGLLILHIPTLLRQDYARVPAASWLGMLYGAGLSNAAAMALYVWCVRRSGAARTALLTNLGPVLTALGAWVFLGEVWSLVQWCGVALVISGVVVARWDYLQLALRDTAA